MREDHRELRRQNLRYFLAASHTTAACRIPGSYGLFLCNSLAGIPEVLLVTRCQLGAGPEASVASIWPGERTQGVARRLARLVVAVTVSGGGLILVIRGPG